MRLILTPWKNLLFERARAAKKSVTLISPFIKSNIVNGLLSEISDAAISVKAVTRHKAIEFAAGVSDIDAAYSLSGFAFESPRNFEVRFHDQLHAKIFIFDDEVAYVGSSNLTFSGLQRNYEAVVEIVDADSIAEICKEVELYWVRAQPITKSGFTELFSAVQAYSREKKVVAEDEHFYQITDGSPGQPSEPTTDDANFTAAEIAPPIVSSVEEPARITESAKSSVEISPAEDKSTSIDFEATFLPTIDNFLQMVSNRFNLNPHDNLSLYVATIFQVDALNVLQRTKLAERAPYLSDLVDSKTALSLIAVGKAVFELCISQIAIRAGIMRRYGPPAVSLLIGVISQKRMLATLWHQNFLGPLISLPSADIGKSAFADACFRLFAAVSETHGFETCSAIIERFWNPLDLLGTDVISVLAYKDPKTELQEIVQAASGRFTYSEYENLGSEHITDWSCTLGVGSIVVKGRGDSKGLAEADAASRALAMMYRMPRWQKVIEERRATQISLLRKRGPWLMRPKVDLSVSTRARIREAYQTRLNWNIDPELGFLAQIDRSR
jgi:PLD-like domain/Double-stranded RNA binding motif